LHPYDGPTVIVNGPPSSGTHTLQAALALNGVVAERGHWPPPDVPTGHCLMLIRNLRDVIVARVRYRTKADPTEQGVIENVRQFFNGQSLTYYVGQFVPLLSDTCVHVVSYARLLTDPDVIQAAVAFAGGRYREGSFEALAGTPVAARNLAPLFWERHWTPAIEAEWQQADMPALEAIWAPHI
jgi:hypothetical protein